MTRFKVERGRHSFVLLDTMLTPPRVIFTHAERRGCVAEAQRRCNFAPADGSEETYAEQLVEQEMIIRERALINHPPAWPHWPILPMKRRNRLYQAPDGLGFLVDFAPPYTVYIAILADVGSFAHALTDAASWHEFLKTLPQRQFNSAAELLTVYAVD